MDDMRTSGASDRQAPWTPVALGPRELGALPAPRVHFSTVATLSFEGYEETFEVFILNLSDMGIACTGPRGMRVGDTLNVAFRLQLDEPQEQFACRVIWVHNAELQDGASAPELEDVAYNDEGANEEGDAGYGMQFIDLSAPLAARVAAAVRERACGRTTAWPLPGSMPGGSTPVRAPAEPAKPHRPTHAGSPIGVGTNEAVDLAAVRAPCPRPAPAAPRQMTEAAPPPRATSAPRPAPAAVSVARSGVSRPSVWFGLGMLAGSVLAATTLSRLARRAETPALAGATPGSSTPMPPAANLPTQISAAVDTAQSLRPAPPTAPAASPPSAPPAAPMAAVAQRVRALMADADMAPAVPPSRPAFPGTGADELTTVLAQGAAAPAGSDWRPRIEGTRNQATLILTLDGPAKDPHVFWMAEPRRLVVDVADRQSAAAGQLYDLDHAIAVRVRVGQHPDKVRFVIETGRDVTAQFSAHTVGNTVRIDLRRP